MIVAIGSHPDDVLLGCGGTLRHLASAGRDVAAVVVTNGEQTSLSDDAAERIRDVGDRRRREAERGFDCLGIDDTTFLELPDLGVSTAKLLDRLPRFDGPVDLVFTHSPNDSHPDHRATARAVCEQYDESKVLHMESPSTTERFAPTLLVDVAGNHDEKIRALQRHETQQHKRYMRPETVRKKLSDAGAALDLEFAERFETGASDRERFEDLFETTAVASPTPNPATEIEQ